MCGIAGIFDPTQQIPGYELEPTVRKMSEALVHRGPDDSGCWVDLSRGIALAHRRLSILDLSPEGHQPMGSATGRYTISFNGEIYNFSDLSVELGGLGHRFNGRSDTEVILAAVTQWGFEGALTRFNGMFALAIWDAQERALLLARDRLGEKPLYYGWVGKAFVFGSELKALRAHPLFEADIDRSAIALYFRFSCVPSPYSIYRGIQKLPPGTMLVVRASRLLAMDEPTPYWSARKAAEDGLEHPFTGPPDHIVEELDRLLRDAVRIRMRADVPVGAFLSGGVDSSTIVGMMQAQSARPIKTFSVGVEDPRMNEAGHARRVAEHLGTDHTELLVTASELLSVVPQLPRFYDEPFADSSQVPTYLISALARQQVTVSLSGEGGDELFAGYHRHFWRMWERMRWAPLRARKFAARALEQLAGPSEGWRRVEGVAARVTPYNPRDKLYKLSTVLGSQRAEEVYLNIISHWRQPTALVIGSREERSAPTDPRRWANLSDSTRRMMFLDLQSYLPDDILVKLDRATMAVSLEGRVPFVDHRVVEFAAKIGLDLNLRHPAGKWVLREVLKRYVPPTLTERPKQGFGIPIAGWLRGPLRDWAEPLLSTSRLRSEGFLDPIMVRTKWNDFIAGGEWQYAMWDVLMFQAWLDETEHSRSAPSSQRLPELGRSATVPSRVTLGVPERPMRILHVFGRMDRGGAEMRTLELMRYIDRTRFKFEFATLSGLPGSLDDAVRGLGGKVHPCRLGVGFLGTFRKLLREGHYDVVQSHVHHTTGLILRLAMAGGVPIRIAHFRVTEDGVRQSFRRRVQRRVMKEWIDQCATDILAVSEGTMREAWRATWQDDARCRVIYNGLDLHAIGARQDDVRRELDISDSSPLVLHVGTATKQKNKLRLLDMFAAIVQQLPTARLLVVGRDADGLESAMKERIHSHDIERSVSLLWERTDVARLLWASDLFLFPSLWEGMPGAVLEACGAGLPVLASDISGIREIARHISTVECLSLDRSDADWAAHAVRLLAMTEPSGAKRGAAARAFAKSVFTVERAIQEYTEILNASASRLSRNATATTWPEFDQEGGAAPRPASMGAAISEE